MSGRQGGNAMKPASAVTALAVGICLAAMAVACQGGDEEETPGASATPTAVATGSPAPATAVPGITDTQILLGAHAPLSGTYGAVYSMIPRATEAYFKYVNETQGGVCGRQIVYKVEDNSFDPAKALEAVRKLVEQDKVFAIVGALGDLPHLGAWDYLNENGVPDLLVSGGTHRYGSDPEGHPLTFQMLPSYKIEATLGGRFISETLPGKKVGFLGEMDGHDDALAGLQDGLDPSKNELVAAESYEPTALDVRSQVINLHNSGAEVVVLGTSPGFLAQAIKEADRLDWHPLFLAGYVNSDDIIFQFASPKLLEGMITSQAFKLAAGRDDPDVAEHYELMQKYDGPAPTNFSIYAQALGELTVEILGRTCDDLTREGLLEAVKSIKDWRSDLMNEGISITFGEKDHTAIQAGRMMRATIVNGKGKFEFFGPLFVFKDEELQ
jgi:ABC-type branched-subunit amino acid transport system substrate-binding protein